MNMTLDIEKSAYGGQSISHCDGKIIFVPFTIPGEKIICETVKNKSDYAVARVIDILEPSSDRITPDCPNFSICGGCDYLHMSYDREITEKIEIISDTLIRSAKMGPEQIPQISVLKRDRFNYRTHARIKHSRGKTGFFGKDSHTVIPFPENGCLLLNHKINAALGSIRFRLDETHVALDSKDSIILSSDRNLSDVSENVNETIYNHSIGSFFQRNSLLREDMIARVVEYSGENRDAAILELGCGCGFFSIPLARVFKYLKGIDVSGESIEYAIRNAELNNITNISFSVRDDATLTQDDSADIIVADPPRAGLSAKTIDAIIRINPEKIVYVSCSPPTWARDLRILIDNGYELKELTMIDMFPGTKHIEIISQIGKRN